MRAMTEIEWLDGRVTKVPELALGDALGESVQAELDFGFDDVLEGLWVEVRHHEPDEDSDGDPRGRGCALYADCRYSLVEPSDLDRVFCIEASKRATLLRRCALPAPKTFDGYDWSAVSWPEGMGRESLLALDFVERREDLVLMGDVGTGKTHMASALCALACERRLDARFFTASSLVMRLRRARDDGRLDREAAIIGKARLLVIDELGFLPLDADGARLLFQVLADAYERQSVVFTTNLEFSRCGRCSGTTRWPPP